MYAELHAHSAFSFLDGASLPDELAGAAAELGYEAMALTDHNSVSGSMEFAQAAAALGLRAIHGAEVDLDDGRHITLLVEDETGWRNLCRILTRAHRDTREKQSIPMAGLANSLRDLLNTVQRNLLDRARQFREEHTIRVNDYNAFKEAMEGRPGFIIAPWCGEADCEAQIKTDTQATIRNIPFTAKPATGKKCLRCDAPATTHAWFAKSY